jgi:hypothetical protein
LVHELNLIKSFKANLSMFSIMKSDRFTVSLLTLSFLTASFVGLSLTAYAEEVSGDDVVLECLSDVNLIQNGSFESPSLAESLYGWDVVPAGTPGLIWSVSWLTADDMAPNPALLELQNSLLALNAFAGNQYAELDSNWTFAPGTPYLGEDARVRIAQTVTTIPGATYRLSYAFSALPRTASSNNHLEVLIDGLVVSNHTKDGTGETNTNWSVFGDVFVAGSESTTIAFQDAGVSDSFGTLLDDVRLCLVREPAVDDEDNKGGNGGNNDQVPSGRGGGYTPIDRSAGATETIAGETATATEPTPSVLGEQVSIVPVGAPNAGAGGTATPVFGYMLTVLATPRRFQVA